MNGKEDVWFATGGSAARVFHSSDSGATWGVTETPIMHGAASEGIFSIAFRDPLHGVIAGGDYAHPDQGGTNLATTADGGKNWKLATPPQTRFFSGISYVKGTSLVMVGSGVTAFLSDGLYTYKELTQQGFNAVDSKDGITYAAGANGRIIKLAIPTSLR